MGKADLTEKNLLRYKDVFSDVANVNLFHGEKVLAEEDIVEEQTELIFKSPVDGNIMAQLSRQKFDVFIMN